MKRMFAVILGAVLLLSSMAFAADGATYTVVDAPSGLNVRTSESGGAVQDILKNGTVVTVTGESKYWYKIQYGDGKTGYAYKEYLQPATYEEYVGAQKPKKEFIPPTANDGKFIYEAVKDAKVYESRDKGSKQLGTVLEGEVVYVSKTWKYWYQVVLEYERYAYVWADDFEFLEVNLPDVGELRQLTSRNEGTTEVYVRESADAKAKVVKKLALGTNVRLLSTDGNWAEVVYDADGNVGYVYKNNIK
ncbi:MAG: SH3 domain-containing protein [Clostridia bacterium]|nr:SH3 domain-containing protein [Clostridia bacterium]